MTWFHKATLALAALTLISFFSGAIGPGLGFLVLAVFFGALAAHTP